LIDWRLHRLDDLAARELYLLMQLRQDVFVVEQKCPYPDLDGADASSLHLSAWRANEPLAYLRIIPPEVHKSGCPSLGRICTASSVRRTGIGRELVQRGLDLICLRWPGHDCQIGAQAYLRNFYETFGFAVNGEQYIEDGIPHFPMRWYASTRSHE
jgi:ElaA protein